MEKRLEELTKLISKFEELLRNHEGRIERLEGSISIGPLKEDERTRQKKLSVKEFLRSKRPRTDVHKTLAIGYYLEKYDDMASVNVYDVREGFRAAKEKVPSNVHAFIDQNIRNGHMMDYGEKKDKKKAYVLTNSGEEFVENGFKKENN